MSDSKVRPLSANTCLLPCMHFASCRHVGNQRHKPPIQLLPCLCGVIGDEGCVKTFCPCCRSELNDIVTIWRAVSEDFSIWDVGAWGWLSAVLFTAMGDPALLFLKSINRVCAHGACRRLTGSKQAWPVQQSPCSCSCLCDVGWQLTMQHRLQPLCSHAQQGLAPAHVSGCTVNPQNRL